LLCCVGVWGGGFFLKKKQHQLLVYKKELNLAREDDVFCNVHTLLSLSLILTRDLSERFVEWKAGDSIADVFLIAVQGLRCYAAYYANFEVVLPMSMAQLRQKPEFVSSLAQIRLANHLGDLTALLKCPLDRVESYRVFGALLKEHSRPGPERKVLEDAVSLLESEVQQKKGRENLHSLDEIRLLA
jgi:hypothetical protein